MAVSACVCEESVHVYVWKRKCKKDIRQRNIVQVFIYFIVRLHKERRHFIFIIILFFIPPKVVGRTRRSYKGIEAMLSKIAGYMNIVKFYTAYPRILNVLIFIPP